MTDIKNAEKLYKEYLTRPARKTIRNVCNAYPNFTGCDFCDLYAGPGKDCWKQNATHKCIFVTEEKR